MNKHEFTAARLSAALLASAAKAQAERYAAAKIIVDRVMGKHPHAADAALSGGYDECDLDGIGAAEILDILDDMEVELEPMDRFLLAGIAQTLPSSLFSF